MDWSDAVRVLLQNAAGTWVDITDYVRHTRGDFRAFRGRQNEQDAIAPGQFTLALDNASGIFTPGVASAALAITLGMPIQVVDTIGYRSFPIFTGTLEMPDATEQLEGVDNIISVTAVDLKQVLDNSRTFVSNLAEYVMNATDTLVCYYPLTEPVLPFRDIVGNGPPLTIQYDSTSLADANTAQPGITPAGGAQAFGDDARGVAFAPTTSSAGGFGFPTLARGWQLTGDFSDLGIQFAAGVPLTMILWASLTDGRDSQYLLNFGTFEVGGFTQSAAMILSRIIYTPSSGAFSGLLDINCISASGGTFSGEADTTAPLFDTGGMVPIGVQITYSPNSLKLWLGTSEYTGTLSGSPISPQRLYGAIQLGAITGTLAHFQIHVGSYTHADFLAQVAAGGNGLDGQRTDERIATVLRYAGVTTAAALDEGSTFMQRATLAGKTAGQVIDEAVDTERGRFFIDGAGVPTFHSRVRAYNL